MKNADIKFVVGSVLLTAGLVLLAIGGRWLFFTGLAMVMISGLFTLRQKAQVLSVIGWLFYIGAVLFLVWFSRLGAERPSLFILAVFWAVIVGEEFYRWRNSRKMT
jgi:hypothetical protein